MHKKLEELDNFLESQNDAEQKIIFFLPILIIGFIMYYFIFPITDELVTKVENENYQLKLQLNTKNNQIMKTINTMNKLNIDDSTLTMKVNQLKKTEIIVKNLMEQVKFLIFNFNKWAKIYNSIPEYLKDNNLLLLKLDNELFLNEITKTKKLVNLKMRINLEVLGDFKNVIKLINIFEAKKMIVKIEKFKTDGVKSNITIDIYGAEL